MNTKIKTALLVGALGAGMLATAVAAHDMRGGARGGERPDFSTLDTDGNGQISAEEFEARGAVRFAALDTDGDGKLSAEELSAAEEGRRAERITRMIERFDTDGDGMLSSEEMSPENRRSARMMERLDTDEDGTISAEEYEAAEKGRGDGKRKGGKGRHGHGH